MKAAAPFLVVLVLLLGACGGGGMDTSAPPPGVAALQVTSSAFKSGEPIPEQYTCTGDDLSLPVQWSPPPRGTQSLVLLMDDPDANDFVHWILYNLPGGTTAVAENLPKTGELPDGSRQGTTSFRRVGYGGPCPPSGTHHYVLRVYALDTVLPLSGGAGKNEVLAALEGHVLAQGELIGIYAKP